ncbi:MAG: sigma-70 family RNA polymerase sigma factor [Bryobacteraceae bacterium]|nr:sigma-70 family RNA polymerase sigma factor [Bryobacteraceae bacterium]
MPTDTRIYDLNLTLPRAPTCESCIQHLSEALQERPGVQSVQRSPEGDKLLVDYDPEAISPQDLDAAVDSAGGAVTRRYRHERLSLTEMDCPECARTIEAALANLPGVVSAHVEFAIEQLDLSYDTEVIDRSQIIARIRKLGYDVAEAQPTVLRFRIEGLDCLECVRGVEGVVESVPGVVEAEINFAAATMAVTVLGTDDLPGAITRAVADQARTIRIPVHMIDVLSKLRGVQRRLTQTLRREPTTEEIATASGMPLEEVRRVLDIGRHPMSLDRPVGDNEDACFGDFLEDRGSDSPLHTANRAILRQKIESLLKTLTWREREIIRLRYGLHDGYSYTLEEVGRIFKVTRERVRQIEAKAVKKLQHPVRSMHLEGFLRQAAG